MKWQEVKDEIKSSDSTLKKIDNKPTLSEHTYGNAITTDQIIPSAKKAGGSKLTGNNLDNFIVHEKGVINSGASPYTQTKELLQDQVYDKSLKSSVIKSLFDAFKEKIEQKEEGGGSLREKYLGGTPGKNEATGRKVQARMRADKMLKEDKEGNTIFKSKTDGKWYPLDQADMCHLKDAVTWWNTEGRKTGAKSSTVRAFMLDADNYILDHFHYNRSEGSKLGQKENYLPPLK